MICEGEFVKIINIILEIEKTIPIYKNSKK